MTRAQSLSINTLIIAALAILVLIIAAAMYNKYWRNSDDTISNCENMGGKCIATTSCADAGYKSTNFVAKCGTGELCCMGRDG